MPKNKIFHLIINLLFITTALFFINYQTLFNNNFNFSSIFIIIILFLLIHLARFARMYFILLEDLINPNRFLQLYIKTTLVSTLIPFKIGEIYKMYCYGVETGKTLTGITTVVIEKFFDALILCLFMTPYTFSHSNFTPLYIILCVFIIIALILYFSFEGTYHYLNNFLIRRGGGRKSLTLLKILEGIKKGYDSAKHTLRGRFVLLLFLSIIAWGVESFLVIFLNSEGLSFNFSTIFNYISDGFFGISNALFNHYSNLCATIFTPLLLIIYGKKYIQILKKQERRNNGKISRNL